jgi:putative protease
MTPCETEIIAPLGCPEHAEVAMEERPDAVYIGVKGHSSRPDRYSFDLPALPDMISSLRKEGIKSYIALNAEMRHTSFGPAMELIEAVDAINADGIIISDVGMLHLASAKKVKTPLHISSLTGVINSAAVKFLAGHGIKRIILPTCLFVEEIAMMTDACPDIEYEIIISNGVCFNDSWRCGLKHRMDRNGSFDVQCRHVFQTSASSGNRAQRKELNTLWAPDIDSSGLLPFLYRVGVRHYKIEGRTQPPAVVRGLIRAAKEALKEIHSREPENRFHYVVHPSWLNK